MVHDFKIKSYTVLTNWFQLVQPARATCCPDLLNLTLVNSELWYLAKVM